MPNDEADRRRALPRPEIPLTAPLWPVPAHIGHSGGPPLDRPGRFDPNPSVLTPELQEALFDRLSEGIPLRVICRLRGMPSRATIYRRRRTDREFERRFRAATEWGVQALVDRASAEFEWHIENSPLEVARHVFNVRRSQLARMNPKVFSCRGLRC